ncbi:MAG: hypothetical protein ACJ8AX_07365, partial [Gemmatimonadales bacterium]
RAPALLLALAVACAGGNQGAVATSPSEQTRARIENRASLDMDIYVRRNDGKSNRLGFVAGGEITYFGLPPTLTAGATWVRFEARPVRSSGQPVLSEIFPVKMGEEISWSIPPQ